MGSAGRGVGMQPVQTDAMAIRDRASARCHTASLRARAARMISSSGEPPLPRPAGVSPAGRMRKNNGSRADGSCASAPSTLGMMTSTNPAIAGTKLMERGIGSSAVGRPGERAER